MARGMNTVWIARSQEVGFERNTGSFFALKLTLEERWAKKFSKNLTDCLKHANRFNKNQIEVIAHFGNKGKEGFLL